MKKLILIIITLLIISFCALAYFLLPPRNFPTNTLVKIEAGSTLSQTARVLERNGVVKSQFLLKLSTVLISGSTNILKGDYVFDEPQSALRIAYRLSRGLFGFERVKVTIPEGTNSREIAKILQSKLPKFDIEQFILQSRQNEGYLFPDTYYFYENADTDDVINTMVDNFERKLGVIKPDILKFGKPIEEVIKMASLVEKEASSSSDRKIIAGILWKRLDADMPLQVDAPFFYFLDKDSLLVTLDDLSKDSPYNLYKNIGLPPTPIANPGLDAILDTISPTSSVFWYYLSDINGTMHYAVTHDAHIANKDKYLR